MVAKKCQLSRRRFLGGTACGLVAPYFVNSRVLGGCRPAAAQRSRGRGRDRLRRARDGLVEHPQRPAVCYRRGMRRGQRPDGRGPETRRILRCLPRFPSHPGPPGHRCRDDRHARPLARRHHRDGVPGRQGRLLREAAVPHDRGGAEDGRGRPPLRARGPDGHSVPVHRRHASGLRVDPQRPARQGTHGAAFAPFEPHAPERAPEPAAAEPGLGPVAGTGALVPLPSETLPLQFPLLHGLRQRIRRRQRRAHVQRRVLGHGRGRHRPRDDRSHGPRGGEQSVRRARQPPREPPIRRSAIRDDLGAAGQGQIGPGFRRQPGHAQRLLGIQGHAGPGGSLADSPR